MTIFIPVLDSTPGLAHEHEDHYAVGAGRFFPFLPLNPTTRACHGAHYGVAVSGVLLYPWAPYKLRHLDAAVSGADLLYL